MGLLDEAKKDAAPAAKQVTETGKKYNNSEYQKKQRELLKVRAETIGKWIDAQKNVPEDVKDAIDGLLRRGKYEKAAHAPGAGANGSSIFTQLFGDSPKVGASISAIDMFNKIHKGFADMRKLMKKWADPEKFVAEVTFDEAKSEYKIVKLA